MSMRSTAVICGATYSYLFTVGMYMYVSTNLKGLVTANDQRRIFKFS